MSEKDQLHSITEEALKLGVIGSPSSTSELTLDIIGEAVERKLVGELAIFNYRQDEKSHYALGQITTVRLKNVWHEDPIMRSLIRQKGKVEAVSGRQDTHSGQMITSAVFSAANSGAEHRYEPSILGTVPPTGTSISVVTDQVLDELLKPYEDQLFYLGNVYGSEPKLPMWFKHFDRAADGAGEAYHLGVFGRTGSGKSVLAKMILLAYSRHKNMSLIVLDPQGEFSKDIDDDDIAQEEYHLPIKEMARLHSKEAGVLHVKRLILDTWQLFEDLLYESNFFKEPNLLKNEKRRTACEIIVRALKKQEVQLCDLHKRSAFDHAWQSLRIEKNQKQIYSAAGYRQQFSSSLEEADQDERYENFWRPIAELFNSGREGAKKIDQVLNLVLDTSKDRRYILVVDLSMKESDDFLWNEEIQSIIIRRLLSGISQAAEKAYKAGKSLNALVTIDEAHRLAPSGTPSNEAANDVRKVLVDAARTTRKYGLGWMFISQTISSLHTDILNQLRISFFGFGLAHGNEFLTLRQIALHSESALQLYQSFKDPHSSFDPKDRQYSFMSVGPVSPLSFSGAPLFFNVFNSVEKFQRANGIELFK